MADEQAQNATAPWSGAVIPMAGAGAASSVRIPVPGTQGLCLQLYAPGGYKGSTSTLFFVEDPGKKFGRQLRLDYGEQKLPNGTKAITYHWNQSKTLPTFGITNHTPVSGAAPATYHAARYFRHGGRFLGVVGMAVDAVSIVQADKPLRRATEVVAGWAGAWAGCKVVGAGGATAGFWAGSEAPIVGNAIGAGIGGLGGCIIGGGVGYFVGSTVAGVVYDWAEDTRFRPLMISSEAEVRAWLRTEGQ